MDTYPENYGVGKRIRSFRKEKGLTQVELGALIGVGHKQIWSYEHDRLLPQIDTCILMCNIFDCSMDYLIFGRIPNDSYDKGYKIGYSDCQEKVKNALHDLLI
ncbi:MAG: helix-turn-helix transcriptional regulator [Pseudobutyrivibrio sp.]|nr:helix-turn-helix transcriptional regulator [Pseudobutyrivibrio sp.]